MRVSEGVTCEGNNDQTLFDAHFIPDRNTDNPGREIYSYYFAVFSGRI